MNLLTPARETHLSARHAATFFRECLIDELARAAWRDPLQYRREMLGDSPRLRRVLDEAARMSGWGRPLPAGHARGVALSSGDGAVAAHVAEMSFDDEGASRVHHVVAVVDGGQGAPARVEAQWADLGLAPALANALTALKLRLARERVLA